MYIKLNTHKVISRPRYFFDSGEPVTDAWLIENEGIYPVHEPEHPGVPFQYKPPQAWEVGLGSVVKTYWKLDTPVYEPVYQKLEELPERDWIISLDEEWITIHKIVDLPLATAGAKLTSRLEDLRWQYETGGLLFQTHGVHTDRESQSKILAAYVDAKMGNTASRLWKTKNGFVELAPADTEALGEATNLFIQSCYNRESVIRDLIEASVNYADLVVAADEMKLGWPTDALYGGI